LYRTNPTSIMSIDRELVELSVKRNNDQTIQSFSVNKLSLGSLGLEQNNNVTIIAYQGNDDQVRFNIGSVSNIKFPQNEPVKINGKSSLTFRVIVSDPQTFKIVASCEGIKILEEDGTSRDGLIDLEYSSELGERFWDLKLESARKPILRVNNNELLGLRRGFDSKNPFTRGVVLPQAIENCLFYLVMNPSQGEGTQYWQNTWYSFLEDRSYEIPETPEEITEIEQIISWCRDTATKLASEFGFSRAHIELTKKNNFM
jgi:hypothetical protein